MCFPYRIMIPMSRCDPHLAVVDVGRHYLLISSLAILSSDKLYQRVVNVGTTREEKTAPRAQLMEEEEVLITPQLAMVTLGSFFLELLPLLQLLGVREGHAIDTLQRLRLTLALPICGGVLQQSKITPAHLTPAYTPNLSDDSSLYLASVPHMRAPTQIYERATPRGGGRRRDDGRERDDRGFIHLYTVVVGVVTRSLIILHLNLLYWNVI